MILDFTNKGINASLFTMASISPSVKESIEKELYKVSADSDGSTDQYILEDALLNLVKDLKSIGLNLSVDLVDILENKDKFSQFLQLSSYLLPNTLYSSLKSDINLRETMIHVLDGSLGDNQTLIQIYLSELGGLDGQPALVPELTDLLDELYSSIEQTETFTDYMKNLFDLVLQERLTIETSADDHEAYQAQIKELIGRMSDAVNLFSHESFYNQLCVIQNWVIKDLTNPSNFIEYSYLLGNSPETLPEELIESYNQKWHHYHVSHMWCQEYFQVRKLEATKEHAIMMYAFLYACHDTKDAYTKATISLRQRYHLPKIESMIATGFKE